MNAAIDSVIRGLRRLCALTPVGRSVPTRRSMDERRAVDPVMNCYDQDQVGTAQSRREEKSVTKLLAVGCFALSSGFTVQTWAPRKLPLRPVQTIPLPRVTGRLDHMGVDLERTRLFVTAITNNTVEVVDPAGGQAINRLTRLIIW
jgi:hypothetical protein